MDTNILRKAGLTESQAKGYLALIEHSPMTPTELAEATGESRTNAYAIVDKLVAFGLARKTDDKKASFAALHPAALETLAEKRRRVLMRNEQEVKQGLSPLIDLFYQLREEPGARTVQGVEGIKEVYADTLKTPDKEIYLLRTTADVPLLGNEYYEEYRTKRAARGIDTFALTPMTEISRRHADSGEDASARFHRTALPDSTYTAPVEIDVYGNKVAFIAFGETQMATIITSPPIAESMRQVLRLLAAKYQAGPNI